LEVIKLIQSNNVIPLTRAQMRVLIVLPVKDAKRLKERLMLSVSKVDSEDFGQQEYQMVR
jgi:ribosome maturation protein SDO1